MVYSKSRVLERKGRVSGRVCWELKEGCSGGAGQFVVMSVGGEPLSSPCYALAAALSEKALSCSISDNNTSE